MENAYDYLISNGNDVDCYDHFLFLFVSKLRLYNPWTIVYLLSICDKLPKIRSFLKVNFPIDKENFALYFEECKNDTLLGKLQVKQACISVCESISSLDELNRQFKKQCIWDGTKKELGNYYLLASKKRFKMEFDSIPNVDDMN